jgi:hypothetical protein
MSQVALNVFPPLGLSVALYYLSLNEISVLQFVLAVILLFIPWTYYLKWKERLEIGLPIFAIISFMYWIYYALSLFLGPRTISGIASGDLDVVDSTITTALEMAVVAMVALYAGRRSGLSHRFIPKRLPFLSPGKSTVHYIRAVLLITGLLGLSEQLALTAGGEARQVITIVVTLLPIVSFCLLFRAHLRGESTTFDKLLLTGFLILRFVIGLASGWLGSFASIIVICGALYLFEKRRVPRVVVLLIVMFTLFFQVGKSEFRGVYWQNQIQASKAERVAFWATTSLNKWGTAFSDPTRLELKEALNASVSRLSLLTQTANVVDMTPTVVPYQYGRLYSYMLFTWIPRFIWPDKPSMNEANRFYQVAYGLTAEDNLDSVSIGVGTMTEGYISFGWIGVVGIMFLLGIFYDFYQRFFFAQTSGPLMWCIGVALLPQMIGIEAQMAGYLGGILQQVILTLIVFLPIMRFSRNGQLTKQPRAVAYAGSSF